MINKDSFYLANIELLRQLAPIMAKKGIEADQYIQKVYYAKSVIKNAIEELLNARAYGFAIKTSIKQESLDQTLKQIDNLRKEIIFDIGELS